MNCLKELQPGDVCAAGGFCSCWTQSVFSPHILRRQHGFPPLRTTSICTLTVRILSTSSGWAGSSASSLVRSTPRCGGLHVGLQWKLVSFALAFSYSLSSSCSLTKWSFNQSGGLFFSVEPAAAFTDWQILLCLSSVEAGGQIPTKASL